MGIPILDSGSKTRTGVWKRKMDIMYFMWGAVGFIGCQVVGSNYYDKDILEFAQSSKNIIDADSEDVNEINKAANVPKSSEMRNIAKKDISRVTSLVAEAPLATHLEKNTANKPSNSHWNRFFWKFPKAGRAPKRVICVDGVFSR
ncbi:hypothetical protein TNCV_675431 [Trichonephila clavipes]|nr:hypothetical protein TNCV_675431 [Trichonephila clavipes]